MRRAVCAVVLATVVVGLAVRGAEASSGVVSWSPAGAWIAETGFPDYSGVIIAPVDGKPVSRPLLRWTATWSPDGRSIAGFGDDGLRIVSAVNGTEHFLPTEPESDPVAWAPDGRELAYVSRNVIYVANADASNSHALVSGHEPAWSPDGTEVAFSTSSVYCCGGSVGIVEADGSAQRVLAMGDEAPAEPVWSPDGRRLAYSTSYPPRAYLINRDGSGQRLVSEFEQDWFSGTTLAWSYDGRWLSVTRRTSVTLFEVDGPRRITFPTGGQYYQFTTATWSPVADEILFSRHDDLGDVLVVGSLDGSQRVVAPSSAGDWSPDGRRVAIVQEMYRDPLPYASCANQLRILDLQGRALAGLTPCRFDGTRAANQIVGTVGPDVIVAGNGADRVGGGLGDDRIFGGAGRDRIVGGPGRDTVYGSSGADRVLVRDGAVDQVYCGPGKDTVTADKADVVSRDCERVQRR